MSIRQMFRDHTAKLLVRILLLGVFGLALLAVGDYLEPKLSATYWHLLPGVTLHLGTALLVAAAVIVAIEISLRKDFIEDITQVVDSLRTEERGGIRQTAIERKQLDPLITKDLYSAIPGTVIRVVGIAQKDFFTDQPGHATVRDKIKDGCAVRVLLLHPDSSLLMCVQNLSKHFGSPDLKLSVRAALGGTVKRTFDEVAGMAPHLAGSFEVRLHKDVFSTFFLYVGYTTTVCGMYLSHRRGRLSPAFVIEEVHLRELLIEHFERLWAVSEGNQVCKASRDEIVDNFAPYTG